MKKKKKLSFRYAAYAVYFAVNFKKIHLEINRRRYKKFRKYFDDNIENINDRLVGKFTESSNYYLQFWIISMLNMGPVSVLLISDSDNKLRPYIS